MRICILCSSLEPGRDGVGDYSRGLAEEFITRGHSVALLAASDRAVKELDTTRETDIPGVPMLRLPRSLPWPQRIAAAAAFLDAFKPDWLSIQFVSYGFNDKGIVTSLADRFAPLVAGRRIHLMLHELWLGAMRGAPLKDRLVGWIQKAAILSFIRRLNPAKIHVTNPSYQALLARRGVHAGILPLFGSIPIVEKPTGWMAPELSRLGITQNNRAEFCIMGIFGAIPPEWSAPEFFSLALDATARLGKRLVLLTVGFHSPESQTLLHSAAETAKVPIASFGVQPREPISEFLQTLDFGVATAPWSLLGKSSATAAMIEHGLPILVLRDDVDFSVSIPETPRLIKMHRNWNPDVLKTPKQKPARNRPEVAEKFLHDLQTAVP